MQYIHQYRGATSDIANMEEDTVDSNPSVALAAWWKNGWIPRWAVPVAVPCSQAICPQLVTLLRSSAIPSRKSLASDCFTTNKGHSDRHNPPRFLFWRQLPIQFLLFPLCAQITTHGCDQSILNLSEGTTSTSSNDVCLPICYAWMNVYKREREREPNWSTTSVEGTI